MSWFQAMSIDVSTESQKLQPASAPWPRRFMARADPHDAFTAGAAGNTIFAREGLGWSRASIADMITIVTNHSKDTTSASADATDNERDTTIYTTKEILRDFENPPPVISTNIIHEALFMFIFTINSYF